MWSHLKQRSMEFRSWLICKLFYDGWAIVVIPFVTLAVGAAFGLRLYKAIDAGIARPPPTPVVLSKNEQMRQAVYAHLNFLLPNATRSHITCDDNGRCTLLYTVLTSTGLTPVHTLYLNCEEGACRPLPRCIP